MLTIYKASAGSGKTYTLAYEYIKLLLGVRIENGGDPMYVLNHKSYLSGQPVRKQAHRKILAITFTNKATSEMKARIIKQLEALTVLPAENGKDAEYAQGLMNEFGCTRCELRDAAEQALRSLLNDYSQFNVSTIDAFFQTILRSFAREIDRQGDYRLELDESTVISQAISLLFDELNFKGNSDGDSSTEQWLRKLAEQRVRSGDDFNPFNNGSRMYRSIESNLQKVFNERFLSREKYMYEYLDDRSRLAKFEQWLGNKIESIGQEEATVASSVTPPADMDRYVTDLVNNIIGCGGFKDAALKPTITSPSKSAIKLRDRLEGTLSKKNKTINEDVFFDWYERLRALYYKRRRYEEMLDKTNTLQAFVHIHRFIDRYRVENNLILISDTNSLLSAIVSEGDTPFIYERVGVSLENFLIDEFQDTSRQQWHNLKPLVANSLGTNADSLIIGDVKQSIYRWRGGDSALLSSEVQDKDFPHDNMVKGSKDGENTNYRSAHELVRFNNSLFNEIAVREHVKGYGGVAQSLGKKMKGIPGYIRILDLTGDKYLNVATRYLGEEYMLQMAEDGKVPTDKDVSMRLLAESIKAQRSRGYRFSDIAILCRDHKSLVAVAEYLVKEYPEIKLVSDEALLLCNSRAVKLIISMLEIIDKSLGARDAVADSRPAHADAVPDVSSPEEEARLYRTRQRRRRAMLIDSFNYHLAHGKTVEEALPLAVEDSKLAIHDAPADEKGGEDSDSRNLEKDLAMIRKIAPSNLPTMIEAIISVKLTEQQRMDELPYITAFADVVDAFSRDSIPTIHSFLNYWHDNERKFAIAAGDKIDAVSILTVHKAKGLEWPCVHLPLMKWKLEGEFEPEWFDMDVCTEIPDDIRPPLMYLDPSKGFSGPGSEFIGQLTVEAEEQKGDNLNVAYVAFTRAVRELDVHLIDNKKAGGKSMPQAIIETFNMPGGTATSGMFIDIPSNVDEAGNFILGEPTTPVPDGNGQDEEKSGDGEEDSLTPTFHVSFNSLNSQLTRLADLTSFADCPDDPDLGNNDSDRQIVDKATSPEMEIAARHGLILHSILAQMFTLDDLDSAIDYHRRDIADSELAVYRAEIEESFEKGGEQARKWFSPDNLRVLNEQTIYNATDGSNRRTDKIVWNKDGSVDVVDFKFTGSELEAHEAQVRNYVGMIREMGEECVRGFLWYPLLGRIKQVY